MKVTLQKDYRKTFGAYLSDIWQSGAMKYKQHMFIKKASFQ